MIQIVLVVALFVFFLSFRQFVQDSGNEASDDEGLLKRRNKTQEEKVAQPRPALQFTSFQ